MDLNLTGKTIARLRKSAGLTQASLAEKLEISDKAVSKWERGLSCPDVSLWSKLSILLDTDIESMIYGHRMGEDWAGVLILDSRISSNYLVYDKPLIDYLLSQFLLVGIKDITIIGDCNYSNHKLNIRIEKELNQQFIKNTFVIYGNQFLYGPNLTKHFMRAMSIEQITALCLIENRGIYEVEIDSDKKCQLMKTKSNNRTYLLPYVFIPKGNKIEQFEKIVNHKLQVETLERGMIHFHIDNAEELWEMASFVRIQQSHTGERIADLEEIIKRRFMKVNQ